MSTKVSLFFKEVLARLTGDSATETATRNERRVSAGIKQQIGALESKLIEDDIAIDQASDNLKNAKYPTTEIIDVKGYMNNVLKFESALEDAKETQATTQKALDYWKTAQNTWFTDVDA